MNHQDANEQLRKDGLTKGEVELSVRFTKERKAFGFHVDEHGELHVHDVSEPEEEEEELHPVIYAQRELRQVREECEFAAAFALATLEVGRSKIAAQRERAERADREVIEIAARLDRLLAAAGRYLEALGPCDGALADEPECGDEKCLYCELNRVVTAIAIKRGPTW